MAAPRLTLDPALESCPDHSSADFQPIRTLLVAGAPAGTVFIDASAVTQLDASWGKGRDRRQVAWDTQVQADAAQAAHDATAAAAQEEVERVAAEAQAAAELAAVEAKKPKLGIFDMTLSIPDYLAPQISNFARKKLEDKEYIELWYWTKEGCLEADLFRGGVEADESFGITQIGSTLSLKPLTAFKASKKVVRDEDLTWAQVSIAKTGFLNALEGAGWPAEHRGAMASFFYGIENHFTRTNHDKYADNILLIYQAQARRFWHNMLAQGQGFNPAIINTKLLEQISTVFHNKLRDSKYDTVRWFFNLLFSKF
ncbi:hypothetical protein GGX14DRAFT_359547 [Mycena pura]|uniref:Uncharacterized protein n=1 Tax=Mycena pura TaxID=153505 RepID=A0AAD6VNC2_9AGAR|nr:hypothetical protein GGX14DRAFT_359547 [Mycena pura]